MSCTWRDTRQGFLKKVTARQRAVDAARLTPLNKVAKKNSKTTTRLFFYALVNILSITTSKSFKIHS